MSARQPGYPSLVLWIAFSGVALGHAQASTLSGDAVLATHSNTCPSAGFVTQITSNPAQITAELAKMSALAEACDMRADFHAHRGAHFLMAGQLQDATTALEKALLLNPELAGAQIDYAQALAQQGRLEEAKELLRQVTKRTDIQPDLLKWIEQGLSAGKVATDKLGTNAPVPFATKDSWRWSGLVQSSLGKETNLYSATHTTFLTLHLTSGLVEVPLSDGESPVSGGVVKLLATAQGVRAVGDGEIRLNLALQTRRTDAQSDQGSRLTEGALAYAVPLGSGVLLGSVSAHTFGQSGANTYLDRTYKIQYEPLWRLAGCKASFGLGMAAQRFAKSPEMDGDYQHLRLEGACQPLQSNRLENNHATIWSLAGGHDKPQSENRPGGTKKRFETLIRHERTAQLPVLERQGTLSFWYRHNQSRDGQVFSSLLGPNPTKTQRQDVGGGYWLALQSGWSLGFDVESTSQKSTNTLLNIRNFSVYGGLRWASY